MIPLGLLSELREAHDPEDRRSHGTGDRGDRILSRRVQRKQGREAKKQNRRQHHERLVQKRKVQVTGNVRSDRSDSGKKRKRGDESGSRHDDDDAPSMAKHNNSNKKKQRVKEHKNKSGGGNGRNEKFMELLRQDGLIPQEGATSGKAAVTKEEDAEIARLDRLLGKKKDTIEDGLGDFLDGITAADGLSSDDDDDDDDDGSGDYGDGADEDAVMAEKKKALADHLAGGMVSGTRGSIYGADNERQWREDKRANREDGIAGPGSETPSASTGKYIPPHLRAKKNGAAAPAKSTTSSALDRTLHRNVNRLTESNMLSIAKTINELFFEYPRGDVTNALARHIMNECLSGMASRLVAVAAGVISIVHLEQGLDVGGSILDTLTERFLECYHEGSRSLTDGIKIKCCTVVLLYAYLYNFKVVHSLVICGLLETLVDKLGVLDVELVLVLIQNCGHQLRSDDPRALKAIIERLQARTRTLFSDEAARKDAKGNDDDNEQNGSSPSTTRIRYMVDTICDLKNNKTKLAHHSNDSQRIRQKLIQAKLSCATGHQLRISWADLISPEKKGRWWLVGAAYAGAASSFSNDSVGATTKSGAFHGDVDGAETDGSSSSSSKTKKALSGFDDQLLKLARKHHMNTDGRRAIFCILMTSDDYLDAFEKIHKLNLQGKQDREVVHVLLHCCSKEKSFNRFYLLLATHLCGINHNFKFTFQYSLWDRLQNLNDFSASAIANVARLYAGLVSRGSLSLACLKVVEFRGMTDIREQAFFRQFFSTLFHLRQRAGDASEENAKEQDQLIVTHFERIAKVAALNDLCEGVRFFLRNAMDGIGAADKQTKRRIRLARSALKTCRTEDTAMDW
eukprot:TRINITY_DN581_c0_g1_i2.p1 TRINITY_DN581_c0_g1~~TRINITY_DN581_c0_g1_i2.p1  ORF type:complete len:862 (-),score=229.15 TRINITY_DN581_c0_g1_i2:42-2600(-)